MAYLKSVIGLLYRADWTRLSQSADGQASERVSGRLATARAAVMK